MTVLTMNGTFNSRKTYFDGVGNLVVGARNSTDAIKLAQLDYEVKKQPIFLENGFEIKDNFANVRTDTNEVMGIVGKNYEIVNNLEAFDFLDSLSEGEMQYECAGNLRNGKGVFMVAQTDTMKILDDDFESHILLTNSFDGSGTIMARFTPIRVACENGMIVMGVAKAQIKNRISIRHTHNAHDKLIEAKHLLLENTRYGEYLKTISEKMATTQYTKAQYNALCNKLFSINDANLTDCKRERNVQMQEQLMIAYNKDDTQNFNDSVYKAVLALSDVESHYEPFRNTKNDQIYLQRMMAGMEILNTALNIISEQVGYNVRLA